MQTPLGVYISVPFCKAKCTFCNFASDAFAPERMQGYVDRLCGEIASARSSAAALGAMLPERVDTVYFGGGTPSLLSAAHVRQIFSQLRGEFDLADNAEITLECAPGQLSAETLDELLGQGLNRVSLGVQSFVDRESAAIGRLHTEQICLEEIARLRTAGVGDINLDLIAGLPHQTAESWLYSVEAAIAAGVPHVSVYMLEVDEDSRLGREMLNSGSRYSAAAVPSEDDSAAWYQVACDRLNVAGIAQYEISNFARAGNESRHNLKYWRRHPYLGFGLDAYSMLATTGGAVRFSNTSDLDLYSADKETTALPLYSRALPAPEIEHVTESQAFEESLFLGLRLNAGVSLGALRDRFGEAMVNQSLAAIREVSDAGLLSLTGDCIALTDRGRMVSNEVFSRLLLGDAEHELSTV
jgi:oxygen-independent coproporphyrinogen III oxidase